ncbi:MAG: MBL fold metallo-hydrolase [Faecousia sp.]
MNTEQLPLNKTFSRRLIKPDTWVINCWSESMENPNPHVLIGKKYAMVVDTTDTRQPLREYLETYVTGGLPIVVASTHSHMDHTGNNGAFNDCPIYMSQIAWEEVQKLRSDGAFQKPRHLGLIQGDYVPHIVKEGDVIDLGEREIEVISFGGCHSNSSIGFLDRTYGIFFPGDEMESGQVLMQGDFRGGRNCVELYKENLIHLKRWEGQFDMICPPHNGTPVHAKVVDYFIENCERILSGIEGEQDIGSMSYLLGPHEPRSPERVKELRYDPTARRSEWMGTSIVYSIDRIFKKDIV